MAINTHFALVPPYMRDATTQSLSASFLCMDYIPIVTISHNNYYYLKFMVEQIRRIFGAQRQIIIMDNQSKDSNTIEYLAKLQETDENVLIIYNQTNYGPRINPYNHSHIYDSLPELFLMTDPDILFPQDLPQNFLEKMVEISHKYGAEKVGFALDIHEPHLLHNIPNYFMGKSLIDWELQFWENPIETLWENRYPLYLAEIDTTFCLVNKKYQDSKIHIRIGGKFTAKHLPWYRENPIVNQNQILEMAKQQSGDSTMAGHLA